MNASDQPPVASAFRTGKAPRHRSEDGSGPLLSMPAPTLTALIIGCCLALVAVTVPLARDVRTAHRTGPNAAFRTMVTSPAAAPPVLALEPADGAPGSAAVAFDGGLAAAIAPASAEGATTTPITTPITAPAASTAAAAAVEFDAPATTVVLTPVPASDASTAFPLSCVSGPGRVTCIWIASAPEGTSYRMFRTEPGTPRSRMLRVPPGAKVVLDATVQPGTRYSYVLQATVPDGTIVARSLPVTVSCC